MKKKEKMFCRFAAVTGNPEKAAAAAGFKEPEKRWKELMSHEEIPQEICRAADDIRRAYEDMALCAVYRMICSDNTDVFRLMMRDELSDRELSCMDLSTVAEIKRTDKGVEMKFFDKTKSLDKLMSAGSGVESSSPVGGLLEAMRLSAAALRAAHEEEPEDGV